MLHAPGKVFTEEGVATLQQLPRLDEIEIDYPYFDLRLLLPLGPKLRRLELRIQVPGDMKDSTAWAPITELPKLSELQISGSVPVDGPALKRLSAMSQLKRLSINDETPDLETYRNFSPKAVDAFRELRPDVELEISGQRYPAMPKSSAEQTNR
jgi:hypothetical protein